MMMQWPLVGQLCAQSSAGGFDLRFYSEGSELNSSFVIGALEGPDGRLVLATKSGIKLFDGRMFTPLMLDDRQVDNVSCIQRSGDSVLFGLTDGGVLLLSNNRLQQIPTGLEDQIRFVTGSPEKEILVIGRSGQMAVVKNGSSVVRTLLRDESLVNAVVMLSPVQMAIATNDGLFIANFSIGHEVASVNRCDRLPAVRVTALSHQMEAGLLLVATEDEGLFALNLTTDKECSSRRIDVTGIEGLEITAVHSDSKGRAWLAVKDMGLQCIEISADLSRGTTVQVITDPALGQHFIGQIHEDSEGTFWASTFGGGLVQILDRVFDHPFDPDWLRQQRITQLFRDNEGQTWVGIDQGIFLARSHNGGTRFNYYHVGGQTVTSVTQGGDGTLWVGTESNGLYRKKREAEQFVHHELPNGRLSNSINAIVMHDASMNVCTKGGLYIMDITGTVTTYLSSEDGLPHNNILYAYTDRKGVTWIANQGNRVSYFKDGKVRFLSDRDAQNITDVHHILEDRIGRLWFATMGTGVFVLHRDTAHNITETDGLPSNYCYQLVEDNIGSIWVRHQKSITQMSPDLMVQRVIGHQHLSPVANTMVTFLFKDDQGYLWVSSTHGVVRYNPAIDISRRTPPRLSILGMRLNDEPTAMLPGMSLPFKQYNVSFDISGVSFRDPDNITYKYRLLGFSDVWSDEFSSHFIQFPRLEDGTYTLEVIASKNDGTWTPEPVRFSFTIEKPFWRTWPFIILVLVGLVAGVVSFVRYRTVKLVADKLELESLVSERTLEIQNQKEEIEKSRDEIARYAKDITDSIKYAQRIQSAIFPEWESLKSVIPDSFVFFRSKDIVSGDFFFAEKVGELRIFAAVDCTGHGVPGGFMSIVANNLLHQAVKQMGLTRPSEILDFLNEGITNTLHQTYEESSVKDGLDIALCTYNPKTRVVEFAGAYNPLYLFRDGKLDIYRGDRFPVGMFVGEELRSFTNNTIQLRANDVIYIFSDGFADQFGGPRGKKLKMNGFRDLLNEIHGMPMKKQEQMLALKLNGWMGDLDQVDDILVIGVRIT